MVADYSDTAEGEKWTAANKELVKAIPIYGFPHLYLLSPDTKKSEHIQYYEPEWAVQDYTDKIEAAKANVMAE